VKHALLGILVACHAPAPEPTFVAPMEYVTPPSTPSAPVAGERATAPGEPTVALEVDGTLGEPEPSVEPGDIRPPWDSIRTGFSKNRWVVELGFAGHRYAIPLSEHRRAWLEALSYHDVVRGGERELVVEYAVMTDDGHDRGLVVCGIGASQVPTCTAPIQLDRLTGDASSTVAITYPSSGGLVIAATGAAPRRLAFAFP
jgi:hypothetical protein